MICVEVIYVDMICVEVIYEDMICVEVIYEDMICVEVIYVEVIRRLRYGTTYFSLSLIANRYSDYYGYRRDLHPYQRKSPKGGLDEEEDDQFNVFICLLCCIMGLGVIIGLVILLCQYVEQKEQEQEKGDLGPGDESRPIPSATLYCPGLFLEPNGIVQACSMSHMVLSRPIP
ncbi:hypothetical protein Btru_048519 [Bulinus truncatus]|nr:hypothetical protein Btru_048519 [Bulinus truncatus]